MEYSSISKLEKGDELIVLCDEDSSIYLSGNTLARYTTLEVVSVYEEKQEYEEKYTDIEFKILSGKSKDRNITYSFDEDSYTDIYILSQLSKKTEGAIANHYDNLVNKVSDEISELNAKISKLYSKRFSLRTKENEAKSIKNIDDFKANKVANTIKMIVDETAKENTDYKKLAGRIIPELSSLAA